MPRKRLDLLLRVFAEVRRHVANVRLLRVGERSPAEQRQLARQLGVESAAVELGSLSREVLAAAYRCASACWSIPLKRKASDCRLSKRWRAVAR